MFSFLRSVFRKAPYSIAVGGFILILVTGGVIWMHITSQQSFTIPGQPEVSARVALPATDLAQNSSTTPARLHIEKIGVDIPIVEGRTDVALYSGAWRSPFGSTPDKGGNTTLFGHRYLHRPPNPETFWSLDKLVVGDTFTVDWQGKTYTYHVTQALVVDPKDVWVMDNTIKPTVTLITCTPLYTTKQRLIVKGELVQ